MKKRKIVLVSDSRCSHSLYIPVLDAIRENPLLEYHYIVTGMHLSEEFGGTERTIAEEGYAIGSRIGVSYGSAGRREQAKAVGKWVCAFADEFCRIKPDIILVQGDRGVSLAAAVAGAYMNIPVAHMFGGEVSGTVDESARHAITKLSHIHFPESRASAERLVRMGEDSWRVHLAGSTGVAFIRSRKLLGRKEVAGKFGIDPKKPFMVVLQHPVSFEAELAERQMLETMNAVFEVGVQTIAVYPGDDPGGREIIGVVKEFESKPKKFLFKSYKNIPYLDYLSLLKHSACLVGNSSGGIIEAPSLGTPVVNIGSRQQSREMAGNIISVGYDSGSIKKAVKKCLGDKKFIASVRGLKTPYDPFGKGDAGERIAKALAEIKIDERLLAKRISY